MQWDYDRSLSHFSHVMVNVTRVAETRSPMFSIIPFLSWTWLGVLVPALILAVIYGQGIAYMVGQWYRDENYGYGFFVPVISLYLIWMRRDQLRAVSLSGSWWGFVVVAIGLALYFIGELAALYVVPVLFAVAHVALFPHYAAAFDARYFVFSVALVFVWILARETTQPRAAEGAPELAQVRGAEPAGA